MKLFNILAVLITLSAVFSYLNYRFIKLPTTIGVMVIDRTSGIRSGGRCAETAQQHRF
jgi:hypothetical protein